ncbi:hypothetical protein OPV22_027131 [Ensete ventricosum]|uniref:Uncharacterized protein n=1 Tax=Ensete ventricosum TaxID=4639 RepID=A0AAV8PZ79_ENSVE|nr:hypothetical protein OPV22_027131 [Ensete ventricosum]
MSCVLLLTECLTGVRTKEKSAKLDLKGTIKQQLPTTEHEFCRNTCYVITNTVSNNPKRTTQSSYGRWAQKEATSRAFRLNATLSSLYPERAQNLLLPPKPKQSKQSAALASTARAVMSCSLRSASQSIFLFLLP